MNKNGSVMAPVCFCCRNSASGAFWQAISADLNSAWPDQILLQLDAQRQAVALESESALFPSPARILWQASALALASALWQAAGSPAPLTPDVRMADSRERCPFPLPAAPRR